ncbi:pentapeptide repeat-containing protein [Dokdonella immobilis]|uniref:pentapeptide repeat-containing protein n=1 Tax=Dokdonella immobilis TaxID=578942 RepID=UPI003CCBE834
MINSGVEEWNRWREDNRSVRPDLSGANLVLASVGGDSKWDLTNCNLIGATFNGLSQANLIKAELSDIVVRGKVEYVDFSRCNMLNVDFSDVEFINCVFSGVKALECKFSGTKFLAREGGADFPRSCTLESGVFSSCQFDGARLSDCKITNARFDMCDFRQAVGYQFDSNALKECTLSSNSNDDWSVLRRKYTGANMVFNLVLSAIFFAPWALDALRWSALNEFQMSAVRAVNSVRVELNGKSRIDLTDFNALAEDILEKVHSPGMEACLSQRETSRFSDSGKCLEIWQVMLGVQLGWRAWLVACLLLCYNLTRLLVTWVVAPMRDEEARSGLTPARELLSAPWPERMRSTYRWLMPLHKSLVFGAWFAVLAALWHVVPRLLSPVWLVSAGG